MASIPNLNTLRRGRGGPQSRGRRGGPGDAQHGSAQSAAPDKVVQQTDNDASSSRLSAVELGYLEDNYARAFAISDDPPPRRYPLINRGTYVRTKALDRLVLGFLQSSPAKKQIVSLGAGSDTRYFRLLSDYKDVVYHELDFDVNVASKQAAVERSPLLKAQQKALAAAGCSYHLHSIDLRDLKQDSSTTIEGLEPDLPTMILSECCLCYLPPDDASATIAYFTQRIGASIALVLYEPIRPFDAFGRTMVSNLASRGIHMQTLKRYASLEAQRQRLKLAGFTSTQGARDVFQIWQDNDWVPVSERERIERLEWLDEVEEWNLLASHYCVAWACRGDDIAQAWQSIDGNATQDEAGREA